MATYYSQKTGVASDTTVWNTVAGGGGSAPASFADLDDDALVIQAGHTITWDGDASGWVNGIAGITITGHATTPGMLAFRSDADGTYWLKMKTGTNIAGSGTATYFGRLMMGGGTWGSPAAPGVGRKQVIEFAGTGAGKITGQYLAGQLQSDTPTNTYVEVYKTAYGPVAQATNVTPADDYIDWGTAPPAAGTAVRVKSSGTLPTGLDANAYCYVRSVSGNKCKLALQNADANIVDITAVGSGNITMYDGHTDTGTKTMNVVQDVTADAMWTTTANFNRVALVAYNATTDVQTDTLATINAGTHVITTNNVDSAQVALARLYLCSRNVQILSASTSASQPIIDLSSFTSNATNNWVVGCALVATGGWTTANRYTNALYNGTSVPGTNTIVFSGVASGINRVISSMKFTTVSGIICACNTATASSNFCEFSGFVVGCIGVMSYGTSHSFSGEVFGCTNGLQYGTSCVISGIVNGCSYLINGSTSSKITGSLYYVPYVSINGEVECAGATITGSTCVAYSSTVRIVSCTIIACSSTFAYSKAIGIGTYDGSTTIFAYQSQASIPYNGTNPAMCVYFDPVTSSGTKNYGALSWYNQGGTGSSLAYAEGTHGDLQACGWTLPDPDWIHTSTFDTAALPAGATTCPLWIDLPCQCADGRPIEFEAAIKLSTVSDWTSLPRIQIIDQGLPWNSGGAWGEVLAETVHSGGGTDWELLRVTYTPTAERQLAFRVVGTRTVRNGSFQWCWRQLHRVARPSGACVGV